MSEIASAIAGIEEELPSINKEMSISLGAAHKSETMP